MNASQVKKSDSEIGPEVEGFFSSYERILVNAGMDGMYLR